MARNVHDFLKPDKFITGTIGLPGERTFYLQVTHGQKTISVALEKEQVNLLATRVLEMVAGRTPGLRSAESATLEVPLIEEFRVGILGLAFNNEAELVIIEAQAMNESVTDESEISLPPDDEEGPDLLRVQLTLEAAFQFAAHAQVVVSSGRPPCPFCGLLLDPEGHVCPRANGYRR